MRELLLVSVMAVSACAQSGSLGAFTNSDDVGDPPIKGSAEFDASTGQYRITGSGTDIWGKADQFHYLWRRMSGDFAVTATARFLTGGNDHRKAVIMLRQSLDADSPFVHLVIHGNGMPGIQFRKSKGGDVNTVDLPIEGAGTFHLKLARKASTITVWLAKDNQAMRELGTTQNQLGSPVLVGLGVSSHTQAAVNTVLFSDVQVAESSPSAQNVDLGAFTSSGDVGNPARKGSTEYDAAKGEYRVTGSGANIWAKEDQFQYVWREMPGNFTVTATMQFLGQGEAHRKAGIMVRQSLETDSAYGDFVIHGNGMPGLQWRSARGEDTNAFDLPFDGPGKFTLKLVRSGAGITVSIAKDGAELKQVARTEVTLRNPVLVGLAVCAHNPANSETVVFSDVAVESTVPPGSH